MTGDDATSKAETQQIDWWECAACGETGNTGVLSCPSCESREIGILTGNLDLPPCWKESEQPAAFGVNRLFLHLDGPGFIGVDDGGAELVTADIKNGEEPDPEVREATPENIRELAEEYNDEVYGGEALAN